MAWYALYRWFAPWNHTRRTNWVSWYKGYLYEQWFYSLPEEEQEIEIKRIKAERAKEEARSKAALRTLHNITRMMYDMGGGAYMELANPKLFKTSKSRYW